MDQEQATKLPMMMVQTMDAPHVQQERLVRLQERLQPMSVELGTILMWETLLVWCVKQAITVQMLQLLEQITIILTSALLATSVQLV